MKNLSILLSLIFFTLISCNSVDPEPQVDDPLDIQANLLNGTWVLKDPSSAIKDGNIIIKQGAFKYLCPCPPSGPSHRYQWQATAFDEKNKFLKRAKIQKKYP